MENKLVQLSEQLRELTHGICAMGPGPYGIGVSTNAVSPLTAILQLTPDPFSEENDHLPDGQACTAEMRVFVEKRRHLEEYLSQEELVAFSQGDDPAARIVAEAVLQMNAAKTVVTVGECMDAFGILADREISGQSDPSSEERAFIASLSPREAGHEMTMSM